MSESRLFRRSLAAALITIAVVSLTLSLINRCGPIEETTENSGLKEYACKNCGSTFTTTGTAAEDVEGCLFCTSVCEDGFDLLVTILERGEAGLPIEADEKALKEHCKNCLGCRVAFGRKNEN